MFLRLIFYFTFLILCCADLISCFLRGLKILRGIENMELKKDVMEMKVPTKKNTFLIETWRSCCNAIRTIYFSTAGFCSSPNVKISGTNAFVDV